VSVTIDVVVGDRVATVLVAGELDLGSAATLNEALGLACASDVAEVAIDMSGVDFLDSTAVSGLIRCFMRLRDTGRTFRIEGAGTQAVNLFRLTRLDQLLNVSGRRHDLRSLPGRPA
jgi:anti-sigma B factor antagonist